VAFSVYVLASLVVSACTVGLVEFAVFGADWFSVTVLALLVVSACTGSLVESAVFGIADCGVLCVCVLYGGDYVRFAVTDYCCESFVTGVAVAWWLAAVRLRFIVYAVLGIAGCYLPLLVLELLRVRQLSSGVYT